MQERSDRCCALSESLPLRIWPSATGRAPQALLSRTAREGWQPAILGAAIERLIRLAKVPSYRSAGECCPLASPRIPLLLVLEKPAPRTAKDRSRDPSPGPANVPDQLLMRRASDPGRAVEARDQGLRGHIPSHFLSIPTFALSGTLFGRNSL